jgi:hypothetical protein
MMDTTKQYQCFRCKQPILFGADKTKLNIDGNLHHCYLTGPLAETEIVRKIIDIEETPTTTPSTTATTNFELKQSGLNEEVKRIMGYFKRIETSEILWCESHDIEYLSGEECYACRSEAD